ncbi:hypothetical protein B14911_10622 [Bacillus sp. NRRL B-14911]|uniref:hypothetical protein n=1 Tax=Bacillus sp. NRRL B-14911 TaxID=313627 RepID=UPI00006B5997|nr:hypothetical protein [Bacillus sp. NRRL B-14911]EAR66182.1 hypothetical protein B14911_10622 [Bacillus sp. NRRL B-14911]
MNTTIATYMKLALTAVTISGLIFFVAYNLLDKESDKYKEQVESKENEILSNLP